MNQTAAKRIIIATPPQESCAALQAFLVELGYQVEIINFAFRLLSVVRREPTNLLLVNPHIFKNQEKTVFVTLDAIHTKSGVPVGLVGTPGTESILPEDSRRFVTGFVSETSSKYQIQAAVEKLLRADNSAKAINPSPAPKFTFSNPRPPAAAPEAPASRSGSFSAKTVAPAIAESPARNPFNISSLTTEIDRKTAQYFQDDASAKKIFQFFYDRTGIVLRPENLRVQHSIVGFCLSRGYESLARLYEILISNPVEMSALINELTINETYFFRNRQNFIALEELIFPKMKEEGGKVSVWSAACATGEEPYSIAMVARAFFPPANIELRASDIDSNALEYARRGVYSMARISRTRPRFREYITRHFTQISDEYFLLEDVKRAVDFHHESIMDMKDKKFDIIFCRNVLIYFNRESISRMVRIFENALRPGGYLFLGHSESLLGYSTILSYQRLPQCGVYILPEKTT